MLFDSNGQTDNAGSTKFYDAINNYDTLYCVPYIYGCTDPAALNYNEFANLEDGSCIDPYISNVGIGITDPKAKLHVYVDNDTNSFGSSFGPLVPYQLKAF